MKRFKLAVAWNWLEGLVPTKVALAGIEAPLTVVALDPPPLEPPAGTTAAFATTPPVNAPLLHRSVKFNEYAAEDGIPHDELGIGMARGVPLAGRRTECAWESRPGTRIHHPARRSPAALPAAKTERPYGL